MENSFDLKDKVKKEKSPKKTKSKEHGEKKRGFFFKFPSFRSKKAKRESLASIEEDPGPSSSPSKGNYLRGLGFTVATGLSHGAGSMSLSIGPASV